MSSSWLCYPFLPLCFTSENEVKPKPKYFTNFSASQRASSINESVPTNLSRLGTGSGANLLIHDRFTHWTLHLHLAGRITPGWKQPVFLRQKPTETQKLVDFGNCLKQRRKDINKLLKYLMFEYFYITSLYFLGGSLKSSWKRQHSHPTLLFIGILLLEPTINPRSSSPLCQLLLLCQLPSEAFHTLKVTS